MNIKIQNWSTNKNGYCIINVFNGSVIKIYNSQNKKIS